MTSAARHSRPSASDTYHLALDADARADAACAELQRRREHPSDIHRAVASARAPTSTRARRGRRTRVGTTRRARHYACAPAAGGVTAITVTKNVFFGANWKFNVHVWDTSTSPAAIQIGAFDFAPVFAPDEIHVAPLPWKLCAQVVGSTVSFIVWRATEPRPAWGDATHGGAVTLPAGYGKPGEVGWYIGHLEPDDRAAFTDLRRRTLTGSAAPSNASGAPPFAPRAPTASSSLP